MNVLQKIRQSFRAVTPEGTDPDSFALAVRASADAKFGDYQANGCMAAAKARKANPREVAAAVAALVNLEPFAGPPEIAGPGFLNVRLRDEWLAAEMSALLADPELGVRPVEKPETIVLDYSSPNVAKPMHVGHIRSSVIGDSLSRILSTLGHKVIRDNHLGDWGTQFGMILWGWKNHLDQAAYDQAPVAELARLYRFASKIIGAGDKLEKDYRKVEQLEEQGKDAEATALFEKLFSATGLSRDEVARTVDQGREVAVAARSETAKLHSGDPENRRLWEQFMPHCLAALQTIYDRLGIAFDVSLGESFYDPMLPAVAADLEAKGLAVPSEGALVIFTESTNAPMMVRKRDGAYTYATSDLAKVKYCEDEFQADRLLYVVDSRQGDHFKQVFEAARKWGYDQVDFQHIAFGTVMGADRRPYKTRDGDVVGLESLLDEAVAEARKVVDENSPDLDEVERAKVAEIVGLGAIKYADLSQNRLSDYVFDLKKMVAMTGNTATYLQYAYARIQSIIRKAETTPEAVRAANSPIVLGMPAERDLAVQIVRLPEMLDHVASELRPNILADYLFGVANAFSGFYENCPVLKAPTPESRQSRLALCDLTARTLRRGLELLGIGVVERM